MRQPSVIPRPAVRIALLLLVLFVLISAVLNVPWALTRMRSRTTISRVPTAQLESSDIPTEWPAATPHDSSWPSPNYWFEGGIFGCHVYDVRAFASMREAAAFHMQVQHLGWPYPVIENKQMWWNWDDPKLAGPESDPAPSLKLQGLMLNPLIVGGAAWSVLVLPWIVAIALTRWSRRRRNRCMACGYPIGTSDACTECGSPVALAHD